MRFINTAIALLVAVALITGCKSGPSIVGKWDGTVSQQGQTMQMTTEYKADGTYSGTANASGMEFSVDGTYKITEDKKLSTTITGMKVNGDGLPPNVQQMMDEQVKKEAGKEQVQDFTFKSNDEIDLVSPDGTKVSWKRVK